MKIINHVSADISTKLYGSSGRLQVLDLLHGLGTQQRELCKQNGPLFIFFSTTLGQGAPSFRKQISQKKVYIPLLWSMGGIKLQPRAFEMFLPSYRFSYRNRSSMYV